MTETYLALGSNMGDRSKHINDAISRLADHPRLSLVRQSGHFLSKAQYNTSLDDFVNAAALFRTDLTPEELLTVIQQTESDMGRVHRPGKRYEPRPIDIDIIFYGSVVLNSETLIIPHPEYGKRKFVLYPLRQIALNYSVPGKNISLDDVILHCPDVSEITEL